MAGPGEATPAVDGSHLADSGVRISGEEVEVPFHAGVRLADVELVGPTRVPTDSFDLAVDGG